MGAAQRRKGATAERELAALLSDELGISVKRMLGQERDGGADLHIGDLRIQVKRCERESIPAWWRQAQADAGDFIPVLAWRASRQPWRFRLLLADMTGDVPGPGGEWAETDLLGFCWWVREFVDLREAA